MTIPSRVTSRRDMFKLAGAIGAAAAFAGTLSACGTSPSQRGSDAAANLKTPTIKAAISYELGTNGFDPMTTTSALTVAANWHTMEGLTEILPSGDRSVYAALGKELPKKIDDLTYEVVLRDGAFGHRRKERFFEAEALVGFGAEQQNGGGQRSLLHPGKKLPGNHV